MKNYSRDARSPVPKNGNVSRVMSANKAKHTKPEILLRRKMFSSGLRGYRLHYKEVPGRPDIVFTKTKVAIFVNGCYWHRCPTCKLPLPQNNVVFWKEKFEKNITRDKRKTNNLEHLGYKVLVVWECELKKDIELIIGRIKALLSE